MTYTLSNTNSDDFRLLAVKGKEPVREWKKISSLLLTRFAASWPGVTDIFAVPEFASDGRIEWLSRSFETAPVTIESLSDSERARYDQILSATALRFRKALDSMKRDDDAYEIISAILTFPSSADIYCADGKIAITQWGMKEKNGSKAVSLLSFATGADPKPATSGASAAGLGASAAGLGAAAKNTAKNTAASGAINVTVASGAGASIAGKPASVSATSAKPATGTSAKSAISGTSGIQAVDKIDTKGSQKPVERVKHAGGTGMPPKKKSAGKRLVWLWSILGLLVVAGVSLFVFTKCVANAETVDKLQAVAPAFSESDIVLSEDSSCYVVANRLNIMVKGKNVDLDKFIADFRKQFPDKKKIQLYQPRPQIGMLTLVVPAGERVSLAKEIREKMQPDYNVLVTNEIISEAAYVPGDPGFSDVDKRYYFDMVNATLAWNIEKGSANVVVAVLDDGFQLNHPELQGKVVNAYDVVTASANVKPSQSGHGQHTSGTAVGSADNNFGVCGIAPGCKVMPVNVFRGGCFTGSDLIAGLVYAVDNGARVINLSLGLRIPPEVKALDPEAQREFARTQCKDVEEMFNSVYDYCADHDVLVVVSAGNDNILAEVDPMKRSDKLMIVSAVDENADKASFSNWGDKCDISAPGVQIYNSIPGPNCDYMDGTSMASPQVAGGAALIRSRYPGLKADEVKSLLVNTAVPTSPYVGPVMDLAAALKADPSKDPDVTKPQPGTKPQRGRVHPVVAPGSGGTPAPDPNDCEVVNARLQELLQELYELVEQYGA